MSLDYHGILVNKNGIVEYIRPCGTLNTEREIVKYWLKDSFNGAWCNSFVAKNPITFKEGDKII